MTYRAAPALIFSAFFCLCLLLAEPRARAQEQQDMEVMNTVELRTIDKLSARTHTFDIPVDKTVKFGTSLFIKARSCKKSSPLAMPESAAFLQIWERKPAETKSHWVFSGWMFSSSPSLSRLDHPVYDVWVIECKNAATSAKEEFSSETAPSHAPGLTPDGKPGPMPDAASPEVKTDSAADKSPEVRGTKPETAKTPETAPPATPAADAAGTDAGKTGGGKTDETGAKDSPAEDTKTNEAGEAKAGGADAAKDKDDDNGDNDDAMGEGDDASGAASTAIPPALGGKPGKVPVPAVPGAPAKAPAAAPSSPAPAPSTPATPAPTPGVTTPAAPTGN